MKQTDLVYRTAFAELAQRTFDAQFQADFYLEGRFVFVPVKGRNYWYFDLPVREGKDSGAMSARRMTSTSRLG